MNKFSFAQMTSNSDGKTSGSGTLGVVAGFAGILAFLYGVIDYSFISKNGTVMTQAIVVLTIGAGLLGYRKSREASIISANATNSAAPAAELPVEEEEEKPVDASLKP